MTFRLEGCGVEKMKLEISRAISYEVQVEAFSAASSTVVQPAAWPPREVIDVMVKKAIKKSLVRTRRLKTKKAIAIKSSTKAKKPAATKPARKVARRSAANVAKLRKSILAGAKAGKTAETIAAELGISKAYVYALKNRA